VQDEISLVILAENVRILLTEKKKSKHSTHIFVAFGYGLTRNREFLKASQKPSRHSARLGAFSGKALRGA
jgi:hypothetical protein